MYLTSAYDFSAPALISLFYVYTTPARDLILDSPSTGTVGRGVAPEGKKATVTLVRTSANAEFQKLIEGKEESWHIDLKEASLKETSTVGRCRGVGPEGKKATVTLVLSRRRHTRSQRRRHVTLVLNDAEFQKLIEGKTNAQKLFMSGKDQGGYDEVSVLLLVGRSLKANNCRATKLDPILKKAQAQTPALIKRSADAGNVAQPAQPAHPGVAVQQISLLPSPRW